MKPSRAPRLLPRAPEFLLEIGTEELPAAYLDGAIAQLRQETEQLFRDAHLACRAVEIFGTPRRLVLLVRALASVQRHPPQEIRGPSKQAAFDAQGRPTPALTGFLKSRGGTLAQTKIVTIGKGEYVYLMKPRRHTPTAQVLPPLITQLVGRVKFPKTMRWDDSGLRFARPVRWLLVLYGTKPLTVTVGRLISGTTTQLGGPQQLKAVKVATPSRYVATLKRAGILLDQCQRKARVEQLVKSAAKKQVGLPAPETVSHGLLDEVTHLVERPVPLVGQFDKKYLVLPRELLLASMAKYQRVFAMHTSSGKLLPSFVAILDGAPRNVADVRHVYEHILNARLADTLLFWEQDHKDLPLDRMSQRLKEVSCHERLGSMADKTARMEALGRALAGAWGLSGDEQDRLLRAVRLAKADLVSTVVKEFPTLQGVVGKYYALDSKEPQEVAEAIGEHYLPLGDQRPQRLLGSALAIVDKYDTLCSYFAIGIEPTGDQDPFGLRRAAQGIVEVAWTAHRPLACGALFPPWQRSAIVFAQGRADVDQRVRTYLSERLYTFAWPKPAPSVGKARDGTLRNAEGPPSRDLIDAVLSSPWDDLVDAMDRILALRQMDDKHKQTLLRAAKVVERTHNILRSSTALTQREVDASRFQEPLERQLWDRYQQNRNRLLDLIRRRSYAEATAAYGETFFDPLHEFFERVMVNVDDAPLQQNRLALMKAINVLYTAHIADLSKLAILQPRQPSV